jgi:hypothetical protein
MIRRAVLALAVLAAIGLSGCNPAGKLVGTWEANIKQSADSASSSNPLGALAASMVSMVGGEVDFKPDGTFSASGRVLGQSFTKQGKWKYHNSEKDVLVIKVQLDGDETEREVRVMFLDNDQIEMVPPGMSDNPLAGGPIPFKRKKAS